MTDDLVKRLREYRVGCGLHCEAHDAQEPLSECIEAADRIEKLEDELHHCFHRIEELQAALRKIADIEHENLPKPAGAAEGTLWVILAGCVEVAEKALEETK